MPLLDNIVPNASADVVGVFGPGLNQLFADARPIKATVSETSKVMEHPVEDGTVITDHRIVQPTSIELSMIVSGAFFRSVYQQIKQVFTDGRLLTVQTKTSSYTNMLIEEMPHTEDADLFDAVAVAIKLKEVKFVTAQYGTLPASKVRNPANASTTQKGQQQTTATDPAKPRAQSLLYGVFH